MYEFSITGALTFTGAYLVALRKYDLRWLGLFISLAVLLNSWYRNHSSIPR